MMKRRMGVNRQALRATGLVLALAGLSACEDGAGPGFLKPKGDTAASASSGRSTKLVERDVEAPEVFQKTEAGLWDGRPSLGGVWVAHPDVTDPQRVIIRNTANNKFVIGALFRREREIPGPRFQASSDAAAALGMLAGAPVELNVTALVREQADEQAPADTPTASLDAGPEIAQTALDPVEGAAAAIDAAPTASPQPASKPQPAPRASSLDKPYIQIGIFSVETNAKSTADQMRNAGMAPTVFEQSANGKPFWRVVVGPARTAGDRATLLKQVTSAGFSDAYAVSN